LHRLNTLDKIIQAVTERRVREHGAHWKAVCNKQASSSFCPMQAQKLQSRGNGNLSSTIFFVAWTHSTALQKATTYFSAYSFS
jgi:hypothetical protein